MTRPEDFRKHFGLSKEMGGQMELYLALLIKWQKAINLVSMSSLEEAWVRHFADSAQLVQYIPEDTRTIMDIGSGAGFPGLVLAIMRPDCDVHLVESDERKAQFLRTVSRETDANCTIHNKRIEDIEANTIWPDLITARALSDLSNLCDYCIPWARMNPNLHMLFLKGGRSDSEVEAAHENYDFKLEEHQSETSESGTILHLRKLKPCA